MEQHTQILKDIDHNSEMGLLQGQKIVDSVDGLEPTLEGILVTSSDLLNEVKKTNEKLDENNSVEIIVQGENMSFYRGEKGDTPEIDYDYIIDEVTKRIMKMEE